MKLHLGCGRQYLEKYINIDYPPTEHTVQADLVADRYEDISSLSWPENSVEEIRSHHVFEHFSRPLALALLCRWRHWLEPKGLLRIETPDAMACFKLMTSPFVSFDGKQQVMRHIFGSHEASWAVHYDGWYQEKFEVTLKALGFGNLKFSKNKRGMLRNIEVFAYKTDQVLNFTEYISLVEKLLVSSTIRLHPNKNLMPEDSELDMLKIFMTMWKEAYH